MSYMNLHERTARSSVAITVLNNLRHWLQGRQGADLSDAEKQVILEAFDIIESQSFEQ